VRGVNPTPLAPSKLPVVLLVISLALAVACGGSSPDTPGAADAATSGSVDGAPAVDGGGDPPPVPDAATTSPTADAGTLPTCPSAVPADPHRAEREACHFAAGSLATATTGLSEAQRTALPIKHVIVLMKENRGFDHMLGGLAALQPDAEVFPPGFKNKDRQGHDVAPFHLDTTCVARDPDHQWQGMHNQVHGGAMDGFVTSAASSTGSDGHFALGYYTQADLPFYYFLASTYALADHYFASVRSGTFPNRDYLLLATSGAVYTTQFSVWPDPSLPTIFDRLDAAGVSWGVYGDDHPLEETLNNPVKNWEHLHPWNPVSKLLADLHDGTVPSVVFVDARENIEDEHPTANIQLGEAWTKRIYDAAVASPVWMQTAILYTYDEAGGFFDHMPPASTCQARPEDVDFTELGVRVPFVAISPWARRHYVSKSPKEHTSITRFIEAVFGLPALTARDANSDALLDMFDFGCQPAPVPAAPAAGSGGCGGANLASSKVAYDVGEPIVFTFTHGPGNAKDWIGIYPLGESPHAGSIIWGYVGGDGHTASTGRTEGTITLAAGSQNNAGDWPLHTGSWAAYFLVNDGYTPLASVQFDIH
jgi:phospholipase C